MPATPRYNPTSGRGVAVDPLGSDLAVWSYGEEQNKHQRTSGPVFVASSSPDIVRWWRSGMDYHGNHSSNSHADGSSSGPEAFWEYDCAVSNVAQLLRNSLIDVQAR
jgi:hypothetical protein